MLSVFIKQPPNYLQVTLNKPFLVSAQATDDGMPEPHAVDSVTVQVDGGAPILMRLTPLPGGPPIRLSWTAWATVTGGEDPHTVTVTATDDIGRKATQSVKVFAGTPFDAAPAAILLELTPGLDPSDPGLVNLMVEIQGALGSLSSSLADVGKVLAGPNLLRTTNDVGLDVLRMGIWIVDNTFFLPPPQAPFPLPRLNDAGAAASFALTPFLVIPSLDVSNLNTIGPSFALSISTTTLQVLADAILPGLQASASGQGATIDSITVRADQPGTVAMSIAGQARGVGFTATISETIGTQPVAGANPAQSILAVLNQSSSVSVPFILWLIPLINLVIAMIVGRARSALDQQTGLIGRLVDSLPARFPFKNNVLTLPAGFAPLPDFPVLVPNWLFFVVTNNGVFGSGNSTIQARDDSSTAISISGPQGIQGYQFDLSGGAYGQFSFTLTNLAPDPNGLLMTTTGVGTSLGGEISIGGLDQSGSFEAKFGLPLRVVPGNYTFTLSMSATETCGTDASKTLTGSGALPVTVEVMKEPKLPP
jgi:hypothetical protein